MSKMKVCLIQPGYSTDYSLSDDYFKKEIEFLDKCDDSMDIVVMPESCDIPCLAHNNDEAEKSVEKYNKKLIKKVKETAKRCSALIFFNARFKTENGYRNTTYAVDKNGEIAGRYYKKHLVKSESESEIIDSDYSYEMSEPYILDIDGIRYGFLTCYDFYFYEQFANMARYNPDIIIGCSHQRSDTHRALEILTSFCSYNTNAYVLRSSVSMDENSDIGGGSMVTAPDGNVLINMKSRIGMETVVIDPHKRYLKPMGYGNPDGPHHDYIEAGRRPWYYRNSGSSIVNNDNLMRYPRVCAHRGFNTIAPENSLPAYGAAVAMGADEIEFDLWNTKDGKIVSIHDPVLDRVSDGKGNVWDYTYEELLKFDFGFKRGEEFKGLKIPLFEEILKKFACHTIMNIHLKTRSNDEVYDEVQLKKIVNLIYKYDCADYVYFMTGNRILLEQLSEIAPDICRCCGAGDDAYGIVDDAIKYGCKKVQLFKPYFNQDMIEKAHKNGIVCNVFWSDDVKEAKKFIEMGIDTILTNDFNRISQAVKECNIKPYYIKYK